jgi:hypothetical protein
MTLLDAKQYDPTVERRRRIRILLIIAILIAAGGLLWLNRFLPEKRVADKFFAALEKHDYQTAYGIYYADPQWRQHPQKYSQYPYHDFYRDWGPGGEWGVIHDYQIYGASNCPGGSSGVVVDVVVNQRAEHAQIWVEKSDKTISSPPCELQFK